MLEALPVAETMATVPVLSEAVAVCKRSDLVEGTSSRSALATAVELIPATSGSSQASEVTDQAIPAPVAAKDNEMSKVLIISIIDVSPKDRRMAVVR